jgi:pyruvate,water dikinase
MPAVIGTGYATQGIKTGDKIRVDGDNGIVTVIEKAA